MNIFTDKYEIIEINDTKYIYCKGTVLKHDHLIDEAMTTEAYIKFCEKFIKDNVGHSHLISSVDKGRCIICDNLEYIKTYLPILSDYPGYYVPKSKYPQYPHFMKFNSDFTISGTSIIDLKITDETEQQMIIDHLKKDVNFYPIIEKGANFKA